MRIIKPYYEQTGEEDPYAPPQEDDEYEYVYEDENGNVIEVGSDTPAPTEETIFADAPELETKNPKTAAEHKKTTKKTIK